MKKSVFQTASVLILGLSTAFTMGCTKERAFDSLDRDLSQEAVDEDKSLLDTTAEYLYVPSSLNSTRTTNATFPMYMGEAKIVKLQLAEGELKVIEQDTEERFSGNPVNNKPVLTIPIEHKAYRCAIDVDGKCTNKEEEDKSTPWAQRPFVKIKARELAVQEINFLPVEIKNLFQPCYNEIKADFVGYKLEKDAINIEVEKTYKSDLSCADNISDISDLVFKVVYHYSLVKLDKIATPKYPALSYSRSEENRFGFFDTNTKKLDRDNNDIEDRHETFLNRWSPNKPVVYHMTENFNQPKYAKIKAATIAGVANINKSLRLAGAELQIDLRDAFPGMNPGDLRVNSIVMVEDPVNYGILGYGPTAAIPRTGEIVHGRAAMYLGVITTGIKRTYEEVVTAKLTKMNSQVIALAPNLMQEETRSQTSVSPAEFAKMRDTLSATVHKTHGHSIQKSVMKSVKNIKEVHTQVPIAKINERTHRLNERRLTLRDAIMLKEDESIREQVLSTHCFYDIANFNMHEALDQEIEKLIEELGAKPWIQLTELEKQRVIDTLLPFVWVPTLIHEIGHTLGLRHNFAGSEDKENFYTKEELIEMGITREFNYSSVMDYGYRSTNELQIMGKYDIAALRFGYAEKLMIEDNMTLISIAEFRAKPDTKLKAFKYCTDEHVSVNPNCNRFDEGITLVDQAKHWGTMYEENYKRRNFRNGAYNFSLYDDATQLRRVGLVMTSLRTMFERYEDIKETYDLADDAPEWEKYDFLKDLKQATQIAGNFFMQVIETPDTLCAVATAKNPNLIIAAVPLRNLSTDAITCFDTSNVQLNPAYVIVGEAGKSFQSRKDPRGNNPYMDQIDVRGIWIDKMLAVSALTGRLSGVPSFDEFTGNFLDLTDMRDSLQARLSAVLLDETVTAVPIHTTSGQVLVAQIPVQFYNAADNKNGHKIPAPLHPGLQKMFGIPNSGVDFQVKLVKLLKDKLPSQDQASDSTSLLNSIAANAGLPMGTAPSDYIQTDIGLQRFYVNLKSDVASIQVMNHLILDLFNTIGGEKLEIILANIGANISAPADASAEEKIAYQLGAEPIQKFLNGEFQDKSFYEKMIQIMTL